MRVETNSHTGLTQIFAEYRDGIGYYSEHDQSIQKSAGMTFIFAGVRLLWFRV
jgi:hypothetical protein